MDAMRCNGVHLGPTGKSNWVHLKLGKEFSRILYPNPVCLLATVSPPSPSPAKAQAAIVTNNVSAGQSGSSDDSVQVKENVMVLSWLTPTNNQGKFMFSINKSRYSASLLAPSIIDVAAEGYKKRTHSEMGLRESSDFHKESNNFQTGLEFTLSVPVRGMEQIVLDVGSISGRHGIKFPSTYQKGKEATTASMENMSNRQRKKLKKQQLALHGVEGLIPVPLGSSEPSSLFAIKGTVAHLKCRTCAIIGTADKIDGSIMENSDGQNVCDNSHTAAIDHNHLLVMAEVTDAYVHQSYWDNKKLLFRPLSSDVPPYLTFFGSQTFGYVTTGDCENADEC